MKKSVRILSVILVLAMVAACFVGCSKKTDNKIEYVIENGEVTITAYTDSTDRTSIEIPDEIDGCPVTKIADFGMFNAESLETIKIGKNVKEIGTWAMTNNQHLREFIVDEQNEYFTAVDGILFTKDMKELVYYPNGREVEFSKYGEPMHRNKPDKPDKNDKDYEKKLKEYEKNLKDFKEVSYTIPDGVEIIRSKAFYKCYYIDHIIIPDSVKEIREKAFHHCEAIEELNLPSKLEIIGKDAFAYCRNIKEAAIPSTIKEIGEYAFFYCESMEKLDIDVKEDDKNLKLGKNWFPTNKGRKIESCQINWK